MGSQLAARTGAPFRPLPVKQESLTISAADAASWIGCSVTSVHRMVKRGQLVTVKCPARPMILRQSVIDYMATGEPQRKRGRPRKLPLSAR